MGMLQRKVYTSASGPEGDKKAPGGHGIGAPVEDVEQVARDRLAVLRDAVLVDAPLEGGDQLVAVLLDHEADELLLGAARKKW